MRILKNLTRQELEYYTSQPTAKKLNERIKKDGVTVPARNAEQQAKRSAAEDKVDISAAGYELQRANEQAVREQTEEAPELIILFPVKVTAINLSSVLGMQLWSAGR